ncbi:MAG: AAA family ATPase [Actinobacteria bacterium]|nr:AAA family ATPase [Actinomycetota bacterium]NIS28613.1 AAA family ATPase [Actinomycetota bacterium]NIT94049.1 AAA family ATPase [Actinomycetota bacterium]NIU17680.1 AAA family ATPase [Actinomycetota bacterium]NIU64074.1 AAA family ATPase [Actinomycetota bacterium]
MDPHAPMPVEATETHISRLFFTPDRVHKLLKPIATGFLDHRSVAARLAAIEREYELNRRLAPDVYLGVTPLSEGGETVDAMLTMRRLPEGRRLVALVGTEEFDPALRAVARSIATFHAGLDPVTTPTQMAGTEGLHELWNSSFAEMEADRGTVIDADEFDRVRHYVDDYLGHAPHLFRLRQEQGWVRDGHGDLTAADIFVLDDGPRILDCLAFSDEMRICDVLADIAFLVMDVHRLAGMAAAQRLMGWYTEFTGEHHPGSLAHHYVAYRAHVRAKVEILRHRQGEPDAADRARAYHRLALDHLVRARLRVVVVGGGPGTGKTTLAHEIGQQAGWMVLTSDEIRKDLAGVEHLTHVDVEPGTGMYDEGTTDATYRRLVELGGVALEAGASVVLDASWSSADHRTLAAELAEAHGADLIELECRLPADEAKRRVLARRRDEPTASDARPEVVDYLRARRDPWPSAVGVDTSETVSDAADTTIATVWHHCTVHVRRG